MSSHPPADDMIPNCVSKGEKVISRCCNIAVFHKSVVEMPVERFLYVCNIFHRCNPADTDLLPFVMIGDRIGRHDVGYWALNQGNNARLNSLSTPYIRPSVSSLRDLGPQGRFRLGQTHFIFFAFLKPHIFVVEVNIH